MVEYREFASRLRYEPEMVVYSDLYRIVADYPENPDIKHVSAGIVYFLGNRLIRDSVFNSDWNAITKTLAEHRDRLNVSYFEQCKAVIASIFDYTFEEIDSWDDYTFFDRLAKAELIVGKDLNPQPLDTSPRKKDATEKRQKKPLTEGQKIALERRYNK